MLTQNHCDSKSKTASVFGGPGCLRPLAFCLFRTNMLLPVVGVDWETFFSRRKYIYCWIFICIYMYIYENTTTYGDRNFQCETTQFILGLIKDVYNQTFSKHGENCECCPVSRSLSNSQSLTLNLMISISKCKGFLLHSSPFTHIYLRSSVSSEISAISINSLNSV